MCAVGVIKYTENGNYIYNHFVNFSHSAFHLCRTYNHDDVKTSSDLAVFYAWSPADASGSPSQKSQ